MTDENTANGRALGYTALAAAGSIWGTGFMFGKWALADLTVSQMIFFRFLFASLGLAPAIWYERRRGPIRIHRRDLPIILVASVLGVPIQFIVQFEGLARTTVSHASLMVGVLPVLLAAGAAAFARERLDQIGWLGLLASTIGAGLVAIGASGEVGGSTGPTLSGDLLVVASLFAGVAWILLSQTLMRRGYSPIMTSTLVIVTGTVILAAWVLATDGIPTFATVSLGTWASVAAMGILATALTTLLWNWGLEHVQASQAGVFINLEPVVGAMLGIALFHESMGALALVGGLLIVGAAVVVSRRSPA